MSCPQCKRGMVMVRVKPRGSSSAEDFTTFRTCDRCDAARAFNEEATTTMRIVEGLKTEGEDQWWT